MATYATTSLGTTLSWNGTAVADIIKIGDLEISAKPIEVTNLNSTAKEYIAGLVDVGELKIEGNFYAGDTNGQITLKSAVGSSSGTLLVTFPTATGASWTCTAFVTSFTCGKAEPGKDSIPFTASFQPTGAATLSVSTSTGLTTPFFAISNSAVVTPTAANAVYTYVATVLTGITSVTVTPTATAGTIVITANGVSQTVATGVASSAITLASSGTVTPIVITVTETGKMPKTYTIYLDRP